jgi:manganese-dependent inorganic pyrophosphatase
MTGRVRVLAMDAASLPIELARSDVAVVGDRPDAQRRDLELGVALLVTSNSTVASEELVAPARDGGSRSSPRLWTTTSARLITLAVPCRALVDAEPLTVRVDDLVADISEQIEDVLTGFREDAWDER